jgi:hypothetical protein
VAALARPAALALASGGVVFLATMPVGAAVNAGLQLAAVVAVVVARLWVDRRYHAAQTLDAAE